jgi:hypothetical protein
VGLGPRARLQEHIGLTECRDDRIGQLGTVSPNRGDHKDDGRCAHGIGCGGKGFGDPNLLVSVDTSTVSPSLTPPQSMHFIAPLII